MEGVGARLGRSSSRYGPAVVFSGRVRKWKKRWVHVAASRPDPPTKHSNSANNHSHVRNLNGTADNGRNGSRLLLYKWTPLSQTNSGDANGNGSGNADPVGNGEDNSEAVEEDEPPRRRFKFVPIAVLEEQKNEDDAENGEEDEAKATDEEETSVDDLNPEADNGNSEHPDINDVPMEENQSQSIRQDLNESTLDLSLG